MVFKGQHRKRLTKKGLLDQLPDPKNQIMIRNSQRGHSSDRENNNTQNGLKSQNGNFQRKHQSGHLNGHQNGHLIVHQNGHQNIQSGFAEMSDVGAKTVDSRGRLFWVLYGHFG